MMISILNYNDIFYAFCSAFFVTIIACSLFLITDYLDKYFAKKNNKELTVKDYKKKIKFERCFFFFVVLLFSSLFYLCLSLSTKTSDIKLHYNTEAHKITNSHIPELIDKINNKTDYNIDLKSYENNKFIIIDTKNKKDNLDNQKYILIVGNSLLYTLDGQRPHG